MRKSLETSMRTERREYSSVQVELQPREEKSLATSNEKRKKRK
jgi:hypothetical protein